MDKKPLKENVHTAPTYSFAAYCQEAENTKRGKYFSEDLQLGNCRNDIFGPHNGCKGECAGTGWVPVSKTNMENPYRSLWVQAELDTPSEDGFHLVPCPKCSPVSEGLDEHIVKQGSKYVLKSKKSGKNLGSYDSKGGAVKRERQVEYFKNIKEDSTLPGDSGDKKNKTSQEHDDAKKKAENDRETNSDNKDKAKQKRQEKEKERQSKKLLPYEFTDQKDAERASGHLGLQGSHSTGNGIYKPGSSDYALRDAVARKKQKQKMKGKVVREETDEKLDTANLPESHKIWKDAAQTIKRAISGKIK